MTAFHHLIYKSPYKNKENTLNEHTQRTKKTLKCSPTLRLNHPVPGRDNKNKQKGNPTVTIPT